MEELSLHILDIARNSIRANARNIEITVHEASDKTTIEIKDDGQGMDENVLTNVLNPFFTTRTTRKVGLGLSMYKMAAEMTGGSFDIKSEINVGTKVVAIFNTDNIDCMPLGDIIGTILTLLNSEEEFNLKFSHILPTGVNVTLDTFEIKKVLDGIKINEPEVIMWCKNYLEEQYKNKI